MYMLYAPQNTISTDTLLYKLGHHRHQYDIVNLTAVLLVIAISPQTKLRLNRLDKTASFQALGDDALPLGTNDYHK